MTKSKCGPKSEQFLTKKENMMKALKLTSSLRLSNMHLFDPQNKIKHFDSPLEIIEEFSAVRKEFYDKRKEHQLRTISSDLLLHKQRLSFGELVISGSLPLLNRPKSSIVQDLLHHGFVPLSSSSSSSSSSSTEDEVDVNPDVLSSSSSSSSSSPNVNVFDYLLNSPISSLTKERMDRLNGETKRLESEHSSLLSSDPLQIWRNDLLVLRDKFVTELNKTPTSRKHS